MDTSTIDRIIPGIYDACLDDGAWQEVASAMSEALGQAGIGYISASPARTDDPLIAFARFDRACSDAHFSEYSTPETNIALAALIRTPTLSVVNMTSFVDAKTYRNDPGIRAILHPQRFDKAIMLPVEKSPQRFGFLIALRTMHQQDFDVSDEGALAMLGRHLARGSQFARERKRLRSEEAALSHLAGNGKSVEGIIELGRGGRVISASAGALAILEGPGALSLRSGALVSGSRRTGEDNESFQHFLKAPKPDMPVFVLHDGPATIIRLRLLPVPIGAGGTTLSGTRTLLVSRHRLDAQPDIAAIAAAFDLTPAESRLIAALVKSPSATEAAAKLALSRETVKSHLTRIYGKMGVASLPQLLLMAGRFC